MSKAQAHENSLRKLLNETMFIGRCTMDINGRHILWLNPKTGKFRDFKAGHCKDMITGKSYLIEVRNDRIINYAEHKS